MERICEKKAIKINEEIKWDTEKFFTEQLGIHSEKKKIWTRIFEGIKNREKTI